MFIEPNNHKYATFSYTLYAFITALSFFRSFKKVTNEPVHSKCRVVSLLIFFFSSQFGSVFQCVCMLSDNRQVIIYEQKKEKNETRNC